MPTKPLIYPTPSLIVNVRYVDTLGVYGSEIPDKTFLDSFSFCPLYKSDTKIPELFKVEKCYEQIELKIGWSLCVSEKRKGKSEIRAAWEDLERSDTGSSSPCIGWLGLRRGRYVSQQKRISRMQHLAPVWKRRRF